MSLSDINKIMAEGDLSSLQFVKYDSDEDILVMAFNSESGGAYENKELQVKFSDVSSVSLPCFLSGNFFIRKAGVEEAKKIIPSISYDEEEIKDVPGGVQVFLICEETKGVTGHYVAATEIGFVLENN